MCSIPKCDIPDCNNFAQDLTSKKMKLVGKVRFRKSKPVSEKFGGEGYVCSQHYYANLSKRQGIGKSHTAWKRKKHPYRWLLNQIDYCENEDGRLGFFCTTTIIPEGGMLDVDHKNGDPFDNRPENLQVLCKCCHAYKTLTEKDYLTPGRKSDRMGEVTLEKFI